MGARYSSAAVRCSGAVQNRLRQTSSRHIGGLIDFIATRQRGTGSYRFLAPASSLAASLCAAATNGCNAAGIASGRVTGRPEAASTL
jgi:hypothetical protein